MFTRGTRNIPVWSGAVFASNFPCWFRFPTTIPYALPFCGIWGGDLGTPYLSTLILTYPSFRLFGRVLLVVFWVNLIVYLYISDLLVHISMYRIKPNNCTTPKTNYLWIMRLCGSSFVECCLLQVNVGKLKQRKPVCEQQIRHCPGPRMLNFASTQWTFGTNGGPTGVSNIYPKVPKPIAGNWNLSVSLLYDHCVQQWCVPCVVLPNDFQVRV